MKRPTHDLEIVEDEQLVEVELELDQLTGALVQDDGNLDDRDALAGMDDGVAQSPGVLRPELPG